MIETNISPPEAQGPPRLIYEAVDSEYYLLLNTAAKLININHGEGFVEIIRHNGQPRRTDESRDAELMTVEIGGNWGLNGGDLKDFNNIVTAIKKFIEVVPLNKDSLSVVRELFESPKSTDSSNHN